MEIYSTEEQQEEAIKRFLKENGVALALGAAIGLGGIFGWNTYSASRINTISDNSIAFSAMTEAASEPAALLTAGEKFTAEYADTNYAGLTNLLMARAAAEEKQFDKAVTYFNAALAGGLEPAVKNVVLLRLARVELAQANYDAALATTAKLTDTAFTAQQQELNGDIYLAKGDKGLARTAYQAAADAGGISASPNLQMKLDDLTPAV